MGSEILGQIACFLFGAGLVGIAFFKSDVTGATRNLAVVFSFGLVVVGAIGPQSLVNFTFEGLGMKIGIDRHESSEEEKRQAQHLISADVSAKEMEENALVQEAQMRSEAERSPTDFLLLSKLATVRGDTAEALDYAYKGANLQEADVDTKAAFTAVISANLEAVGGKRLRNQYLDRAVTLDPEIRPKLQVVAPQLKLDKPDD